jgi:hypothetical protein
VRNDADGLRELIEEIEVNLAELQKRPVRWPLDVAFKQHRSTTMLREQFAETGIDPT